MSAKKHQKGFTLIELLIIIAIIGLVASVVLVSLYLAQQKTRDSRRASEIRSITRILEMSYNANNKYPGACGTYYWFHDNQLGLAAYFPGITTFYGPRGAGTDQYAYAVSCDGQGYKIGAKFETSMYQSVQFRNFPGNYVPSGVYELLR